MEGTRKICATIMPQSVQELKVALREAGRQRPDYIELRLDRLPKSEIKTALGDVKGEIMGRTVLTLRSTEEGGGYRGDDRERKGILEILSEQPAMFVDIERSFERRNRIFVDNIKHVGVKILLSYHNFYTTPIPRVLGNLCKEMLEVGDVAKIVTTAMTPYDNLKIFKLYQKANAGGRLLSFAMGELGQISRIMSITHYGAPFAYCSLGEPIAPGMLSVKEMRRVLKAVA